MADFIKMADERMSKTDKIKNKGPLTKQASYTDQNIPVSHLKVTVMLVTNFNMRQNNYVGDFFDFKIVAINTNCHQHPSPTLF